MSWKELRAERAKEPGFDEAYRPSRLAPTVDLDAAMAEARYETLDDGTVYGELPSMPGVWATGDTCAECEAELRSVAEEWLELDEPGDASVFSLRHRFPGHEPRHDA